MESMKIWSGSSVRASYSMTLSAATHVVGLAELRENRDQHREGSIQPSAHDSFFGMVQSRYHLLLCSRRLWKSASSQQHLVSDYIRM